MLKLQGLKWSDVDLENGRVSIRRTLTRTDNGKRVTLGDPKTKSSHRTIRLTREAIDALKAHLQRQLTEIEKAGDLYEDQGLVFTTEQGTPITPRIYASAPSRRS